MKTAKRIWLWIVVVFFATLAIAGIPSFATLTSILTILLILPIDKWQNLLGKYIKGIFKTIILVALIILSFVALPHTDTPADTNTLNEPTISNTTGASKDTINPTSISTETLVSEPSTEPATNPATESATEPATQPATEPATQPATEPTTQPVTEPSHTHSFSAATCTAPKTCSCGATEGKANGHNWKSATCTQPKTCNICGETDGTKTDHSWTDATCNAPQKCKTCSAEQGSALGHNYSNGTCVRCGSKDPNHNEITYILNTHTKKFHKPSCYKLPTDNRMDTTMSREEVVAAGYDACGICHP